MTELFYAMWKQGIPCLFHLFTGLYCPGCGGTRAVKALLRGHIGMSFQYHPIVIYTVVVLLAGIMVWVLTRIFHRSLRFRCRPIFFVYLGCGIVLVNWIFKNYMLVARGVDLLP